MRWIEDRTEALKKGVHARDQIWDMVAALTRMEKLGLEFEVIADVGSVLVDMYGLLPSRLSATVPFPYDIPWIRTPCAAPLLTRRRWGSIARPGACPPCGQSNA